jgi:tRNA pseudouridine38-40 synthase
LLLAGRHDFSAFSDRRMKEEDSRIVVVERCETAASGDLLLVRIEASHFLWKMVRKLIAFLVEIGRGNATPDQLAARLHPNAANVEPTAPPSGLFLEAVMYPGESFDRPLLPIVPVIRR